MGAPRIEVLDADITTLAVDAIANAANTDLIHGGGVADAIVRAGGRSIQIESQELAPIGLGEAVATGAGNLPSRYVIHAATMRLGAASSPAVIAKATASTLRRAEEIGASSLALVAFGTGVGQIAIGEAARIELAELAAHLEQPTRLERIVFCVRGEHAREAFERALAQARSERTFG